MKTESNKPESGLTLMEVIIAIGVLVILALIMLPVPTGRQKTHARRLVCVNNLRQVGLGFRQWIPGSFDKFQMQISITNGGTMELISSGSVYPHFAIMSNELRTPKILHCPTDSKRIEATNFSTGFSDANISYFLGVDATEVSPSQFLAGDDNLLVDGKPFTSGLSVVSTNTALSWSAARHKLQGNVALADGSVQVFSNLRLMQAVVATGNPTNRLLFP
ncbi:MAG: type II secretion system protein [Verrucomicrobia bacterium]|nr:MAG: type II secretion system protein [Verrucomicrobiota bacterium]